MKLVDKQALTNLIGKLDTLDDQHRDFLANRWLHYLLWWDERSRGSKWKYYTLRSIVIIGGSVIPLLVGLHASGRSSKYIQAITVVLSLMIAISAGLEEIFRFGEIWREKRAAAEHLKIEGWRFFQLIGPYDGKTHKEAYSEFAVAVEMLIEREIRDYLTAVQPKKQEHGTVENTRVTATGDVSK